jgi:hypothetical protein
MGTGARTPTTTKQEPEPQRPVVDTQARELSGDVGAGGAGGAVDLDFGRDPVTPGDLRHLLRQATRNEDLVAPHGDESVLVVVDFVPL